jgi:hypothetical protein
MAGARVWRHQGGGDSGGLLAAHHKSSPIPLPLCPRGRRRWLIADLAADRHPMKLRESTAMTRHD